MRIFRMISILLTSLTLALAGCTLTPLAPVESTSPGGSAVTESATSDRDAFFYNARLGRGINMGNALEAPYEGSWGIYIQDSYFPTIQEAGFDSVRIPIRWSNHALAEAPYTIDETFRDRVEEVVNLALESGLVAVINIHHYDEMMTEPQEQEARFFAIWTQIAEHFKDYPDTLYFEILNEPHTRLTDGLWNQQWQDVLAIIRETNPTRPVIVGPTRWNNIDKLPALKVPDDPNLIVTFHYYSPFEFTHQGASWVDGADAWLGTEWTGSDGEMAAVRRDFDRAANWGESNGVPLFMGEFGAFSMADMDSRQRWTTFVVAEAEARGFSFAYWEFASGFGAFDPTAERWRPELLGALIQE